MTQTPTPTTHSLSPTLKYFSPLPFVLSHVKDAVEENETALMGCPSGEIHYCHFLSFLNSLPDASVDCAITDPAYWTLDKWRNVGTTTRLGGALDDNARDEDKFFETIDAGELWELVCELGRVLKKNAHAWIMCDGQTLPYLLGYAAQGDPEHMKFNYFKPFPVLKRSNGGGFRAGMGYHGRGAHEYLVLLEKGRRRFNEENFVDVFEPIWSGDSWSKQFTPDGKKYPTAKPLSLMEQLVTYSSNPGEMVIDPFSGSGVVAVAANNLGRQFKVADHSKRAVMTTAAALNGVPVPQMDLFTEAT